MTLRGSRIGTREVPSSIDTEVTEDVVAEPDPERPTEVHGEEGQLASGQPGSPLWARCLAFAVLPGLTLALTGVAGYLKWQYSRELASATAATQSVRIASDTTIALLSYRAETVDRDLAAAADRLTETFRKQYTQLVNDVVAPGAKQQKISAKATVPAAASVSATESHAVVLVFVDQTITVGNGAPTDTASSVRVTLDKVGSQWLISQFDPV